MKYATAAAFRQALLARFKQQAEAQGVSVDRLRKRVVFERLLARLRVVAKGHWALKGALALDFRNPTRARSTKDADLVTPTEIEQLTEDLLAVERKDLEDFFNFTIRRTETPEMDQPEPTVRFHVSAEIAGQVFDEARIDFAINTPIDWTPETVRSNVLAFADVPGVDIPVIPAEAQLAEKLHAYTRSYGKIARQSTRVKDLVDQMVIITTAELDAAAMRTSCERVFQRRNTHALPERLPPPPAEWDRAYREVAKVAQIDPDMSMGYQTVSACLDPVLNRAVKTGRWSPATQKWESSSGLGKGNADGGNEE